MTKQDRMYDEVTFKNASKSIKDLAWAAFFMAEAMKKRKTSTEDEIEILNKTIERIEEAKNHLENVKKTT